MPSLSHILGQYPSLLVIDASSARVQAGVLQAASAPRWASREEEAGVGIFGCLDDLDADIASISAFAFCEGPGSILGIRTSAMALRVWNVLGRRPLFGFMSLALVAHAVGRDDVTFIADARRGLWHRYRLGGRLARVAAGELSGELMSPEGFRHWGPLPPGTTRTPYDLPTLLAMPAAASADLFAETTAPDAFLHEEPSYAKWTPHIHRAP
jgi:tRNA threonylcarbamoyladenosine biosynthesis protein TsaB